MTGLQRSDVEKGTALVFALCHEIGNLVGAVRLHAHLLDDDMGPRALALASLDLDDLSARAFALLGHVRPLLSSGPREFESVEPASLLASVQGLIREHGRRGVTLSVEVERGLPSLDIDGEVLHHLLVSLLFADLECASPGGSVSLRVESRSDDLAFVLEDDGEVDEDPACWREQMMRGRPLLCAVASHILAKRRGRLEVARERELTRIALVLPLP